MKINIHKYEDTNLVTIDNDKSEIRLVANLDKYDYHEKIKLEYPIKLECHLRNAEVIGIPILSRRLWDEGIRLISHSVRKPIVGTHDKLYLTLDLSGIEVGRYNYIAKSYGKDGIIIKFVSRLYWELLTRKCIDGVMSVPIEIIEI